MSSKTSRPSREEVHASILLTVRDIAATNGWQAVTVRKVAERIGYTAPIIYEHFGSKDEMLAALLKEGNKILYESLLKAVSGAVEGEKRMRIVCHAYWDFAINFPELYKLMHGMDGAQCNDKSARASALPIMVFTRNELTRFNPDLINEQNVDLYVAEAWSALHGLIALHMSGYVDRYANAEQVLEMIITDMVEGLARRELVPVTA